MFYKNQGQNVTKSDMRSQETTKFSALYSYNTKLEP